MQIIKLTRDPVTGNHSVGRVVTVIGVLTLTFGFYREALTNGLIWQDYIAYATAVTIIFAPARSIELINAIRGNANVTIPTPEEGKK